MRVNKKYLLRLVKIIERAYNRSKHYYKKKDKYISKILDNQQLDKDDLKKLEEVLEKEKIFYNNADHFIINIKEKLSSLKRKTHNITNFLEIMGILLPIIKKHQELINEQHNYLGKNNEKLKEFVQSEETLKISLDYKLKEIIHKLHNKNRSIIKKVLHKSKKSIIVTIFLIMVNFTNLIAGEVSNNLVIPVFTNIEQDIQNINTNVDIVWHGHISNENYNKENIEEFITEAVRFAIKYKSRGVKVPRTIKINIGMEDKKLEKKFKDSMGGYKATEDMIFLNINEVKNITKKNKWAVVVFSIVIHEMTHLIDYHNSNVAFEVKKTFENWLYGRSQPKSEEEMNEVIDFYLKFHKWTEIGAMSHEIQFYDYLLGEINKKELNEDEKRIIKIVKALKENAQQNMKTVKEGKYGEAHRTAKEMKKIYAEKII